MKTSRETITKQALSLPPAERVEVIEALMASLDETDRAIDELWAKEAESRLDAYDRGEIEKIPLEAILARYGRKG